MITEHHWHPSSLTSVVSYVMLGVDVLRGLIGSALGVWLCVKKNLLLSYVSTSSHLSLKTTATSLIGRRLYARRRALFSVVGKTVQGTSSSPVHANSIKHSVARARGPWMYNHINP